MQLEFLLAILSVLVFVANISSFGLGIGAYREVRKLLRTVYKPYFPNVDLIVPCRGIEPNLEHNINALLSQEYPEYRTTFVVDSKEDPAYRVIVNVIGKASAKARILINELGRSSGKIDALTVGVKESKAEILVFADSDIQPRKNWLRDLVAPLINKNVGVATGFRWYLPEEGGFASVLRSAWNAVGIDALVSNRTNFVWGGSAAIRREVFDKLGITEKWRGQISDDYVVTREVKAAGYKIQFVPSCVSVTIGDCSGEELIEWTTRQISIVRVYGQSLWNIAFITYSYFNVMVMLGLALIPFATLLWDGWILVALLLSGVPIGAAKNVVRLLTFRRVTVGFEDRFRPTKVEFTLASLAVPWLIWYNLFRSISVTAISWRGRIYKLVSTA